MRQHDLPALLELAFNCAFFAALALVCVNALGFTSSAANPLVSSDSWHFLDVIVRPYAGGELDLSDLLSKRNAMDHSQPLRRVILLFHYQWFDLDFRIEAMIGTTVALINLALFWVIARFSQIRTDRSARVAGRTAFVALAAIYVSLNAPVVFSWSLVTLNFTSHLFIVLFFVAGWHAFRRGSPSARFILFLAALAADFVADDSGIIATVAVVLSALIVGLRQRAVGNAVWTSAAAIAAMTVYLVLYGALAPVVPTGSGQALGLGSSLAALAAQLGDAWNWAVIPLAASVVHRSHLNSWFGSADVPVMLVASLVAVAHVWFWLRAFRGRVNLASFVAVALMLLFYGLLAGILLGRVSEYGSDYLWQPRYALIYQWNLVALLLMLLAQIWGAADASSTPPRSRRWPLVLPATAAILLLLVQIPLSVDAWSRIKYQERFQQQQALQMGMLARYPDVVPERCLNTLSVCSFRPERRAELITFLSERQLNVFSPEFQKRNSLSPGSDGEQVEGGVLDARNRRPT